MTGKVSEMRDLLDIALLNEGNSTCEGDTNLLGANYGLSNDSNPHETIVRRGLGGDASRALRPNLFLGETIHHRC